MTQQTQSIDYSTIGAQCLALNSRKASRLISKFYDATLRPSGLRTTQFTVLACIASGKTNNVGKLADHLATERTTLTRNLQVLEKNGLITLTQDQEGDRRARTIQLTPKGETTLNAALPLWQHAQTQLKASFGPDLWQSTLATLTNLTASLEEG